MGFLDAIFGKKKPPETDEPVDSEEIFLNPEDVMKWTVSEFSTELNDERKRFSRLVLDVVETTRDLQKLIYRMRSRTFEAGDRTYAAINMIKDTWAKRALISLNSYYKSIHTAKFESRDFVFSDVDNALKGTLRLMDETNMLPKQKIVLKRYFEAESKTMAEILKNLDERISLLRHALESDSVLKTVDGLKNKMDAIENESKEAGRIKENISSMKKKLSGMKKELTTTESQIKELEISPELKELESLDAENKRLEKSMESVENEMIGRLGEIKRIIKLFSHQQGLSKAEASLAKDISHSPMKAVTGSDINAVCSLLSKMVQKADEGSFRLSEKDKPKVNNARELVDSGWIRKSREEMEKMDRMLDKVKERKLKIKVIAKKNEAERMAEKVRIEIAGLKKDISRAAETYSDMKAEIDDKKGEAADYIRNEMKRNVVLK